MTYLVSMKIMHIGANWSFAKKTFCEANAERKLQNFEPFPG